MSKIFMNDSLPRRMSTFCNADASMDMIVDWIRAERELLLKQSSAEAAQVPLVRNSVLNYPAGQNDWKWIMAVLRQSGMDKQQILNVLIPLKGRAWHFQLQALF